LTDQKSASPQFSGSLVGSLSRIVLMGSVRLQCGNVLTRSFREFSGIQHTCPPAGVRNVL
jgi:hypothetical protein